jgi:hypothetical protein
MTQKVKFEAEVGRSNDFAKYSYLAIERILGYGATGSWAVILPLFLYLFSSIKKYGLHWVLFEFCTVLISEANAHICHTFSLLHLFANR